MSRINILNKTGLLTDADRLQPLEHGCDRLVFKTCIDLSEPIEVRTYGGATEVSLHHYSQDIASFITWWTLFVHKDLNGFSGFSHVKFVPIGFKVVQPMVIEE